MPVNLNQSLPRSYRAPKARVRVAIVDSNVIYRAGVRTVLERRPGIAVISECGDSATALDQLLVELNREEGVTLIVVTHAMDLAKRMGRVLELVDGKLR